MTAPPFVLICGCPRSGTYLLADQLSRSMGIAIPVETHFIPHFFRYRSLWSPFERNWEALRSAILAFTEIWLYLGTGSSTPDRLREGSIVAALDEPAPDPKNYQNFITEIFRRFARQRNLPLYGDKSAPYAPEDLAAYRQSVEGLKVIHIVRDGRDVCVSWRREWFGPATIREAASLWSAHVSANRAWGRSNPQDYQEIRYEDFVRHPRESLEGIARFLEVPLRDEADSFLSPISDAIGEEKTHLRLTGRIDQSSVGRWRQLMSAPEVEAFMAAVGDVMADVGYADGNPSPDGAASRPAPLAPERGKPILRLKRALRQRLPLILWLAQKSGLGSERFARIAIAVLARSRPDA